MAPARLVLEPTPRQALPRLSLDPASVTSPAPLASIDGFDSKPPKMQYLFAGAGVLAELAVGFGWYWKNMDFNAVDWELKWDKESWRKKTLSTEGIRFDSNIYETNTVDHPNAGAGYYLSARLNHLSLGQSYAVAFLGSTLWEYLVEFKEKVSINDIIVTPTAGMALGESAFQLYRLSDSMHLNSKLRQGFGLSSGNFHRVGLSFGIGQARASREGVEQSASLQHLAFSAEVNNMPSYGKVGQSEKVITDGGAIELKLQGDFDRDGARDLLLYARTAVAGYYKHKAEKDQDGALEGYSFFIGSSSGYEHNQHKDGISQSTDKVAIVNVLGPSMDLAIYRQGYLIRAKLDMSGDFALVTPYAYDKYEVEHSTAGVQSVLATKRYDYAFGMTVRPSLTVSKGGFEGGISARYSLMRSIGGADRKQEEVTHELSFVDTRAEMAGSISYKFGPSALSAELWRRLRTGTMEDTRASGSETVFLGNLSLRF